MKIPTSAGSTTMTVYTFGLEEHLYSGLGVNQGNAYYYSLSGMLIGDSDGTNTNMFLTDALGSVLETNSATANSASVQSNSFFSTKHALLWSSLSILKAWFDICSVKLDRVNSRTVSPLNEAKGLSRSAARCFAVLSMTGLDLSVDFRNCHVHLNHA